MDHRDLATAPAGSRFRKENTDDTDTNGLRGLDQQGARDFHSGRPDAEQQTTVNPFVLGQFKTSNQTAFSSVQIRGYPCHPCSLISCPRSSMGCGTQQQAGIRFRKENPDINGLHGLGQQDAPHLYSGLPEVEQQADRQFACLEIIQDLGLMRLRQCVDRFQFDDDRVFDHKIGDILTDKLFAIMNGKGFSMTPWRLLLINSSTKAFL